MCRSKQNAWNAVVSWLKPASRVRCLYALGVPAVGDSRVPDVTNFMSGFGGPMARQEEEWSQAIQKLWDNKGALQEIAVAGHTAVAREFSTEHTARQWIRLLSETSAEGRKGVHELS